MAAATNAADARMLRRGSGRALFIDARGVLYVGRGGGVWTSADDGVHWTLDCKLPPIERYDPRAWLRLTRRLFRRQFQALEILGDGTRIVVARTGLYRAAPGSADLEPTFRIVRGSRPLALARDDRNRLVFGEYGSNPERREVHLYASVDAGRSFEVCHTFPAGAVRHVHNVVFDAERGGFWVFVGDSDAESGIGILAADLRTFTWVARGSQSYRVVQAIRANGSLVYGTDSEVAQNFIIRLDVRSGQIEPLREIEGSSLFAGSFGGYGLIATAVEPSEVNRGRDAVVYGSRDLSHWDPLLRRRKDGWPSILQYGTFVLARSLSARPIALVSGQALQGLDEAFEVLDFSDAAPRRLE